ncbi:hypothetical protein JZ751_027070 [Albula glossodonta]|uniref:diacylglycerol O-acyltransferase n=1 Tax=Albula glossodonta TaxID=121402 RepID=A0A8T2NCT2_9TELE|nr:hypothetical protein JZ751_027070 [Albula glossodonta]
MGHILHLGNLVVLMLFPTVIILQKDTSISTGGALLSLFIYTVLGLKLYSYQEANSWYRQEQVTDPDLYYFLLAPTLCYQRDFPRTPSVRLNFLLHRLLEMVILTQLMVGIIQQWIGPIFQRSGSSFTFESPKISQNADTLKSFWGKLNVPFYKWHQRHLYTPLLRMRVPPYQAELLSFLLSAALCEYVIAVPLRTWRLWIFLIMMLELLVAVFLGRYLTGNYGNGLVWLCLLMGPPLAVMTYFHDHYISHRSQPSWTIY